ERQLMATLNESPEERRVYAKGSPEAVLDRCERMTDPDGRPRALDRDAARRTADGLADEGYRVLAMAFRTAERERFEDDDPGGGFVFAGFQAMEDPVRPEAPAAVEAAERAGIRVIMLTGDHARTARAVGRRLGLGGDDEVRALEGRELDDLSDEELDRRIREVDVYARVSPEHKLKLVERLKAQGEIVAVTGDGVNDAPALQTAHLGVAMGRAGTDVAREASDMVLADDNFASITNAVEEGRVVFSNIRKVTYFLLSTGVGEVLAILASLVGPWPLIFLPTQVLWINLVTNGVQDVALAVEKGEPGLLDEPPRDPGEGVLNRPVLYRLAWIGLFVAVVTTAVFWWMLRPDVPLELARSVAMTQIVIIQFFHVLNVRSWDRSVLRVPLRDNPFLAVGLPLALLAHIGVLYVPFLRAIFDTAPLSLRHWAFVVLVGLSIIVLVEVDKALVRRRRRPRARRTT
ncbi:MAG: cation-translocating P-type ATPase, partial [Gemmatimonadota bacterium]